MLIDKRMLEANYHKKQISGGRIELAGMCCYQIRPEALAVGDFLYRYSGQLDAFSHCEVTEVLEPGKRWLAISIDSDIFSVIGSQHIFNVDKGMDYHTPYRAMAEDRLELEKRGGTWKAEPDYVTMLSGDRNMTRRLANTLYWRTPYSAAMQAIKRLWKQVTKR